MARFLAIYLCVLLGFTHADAGWLKYRNTGLAATPAVRRESARNHRGRHRVNRSFHHAKKRRKTQTIRRREKQPNAASWDDVIRRNSPSKSDGESQGEMMPEEYRQWMKNLSNSELDLYLKFRITDAIPFAKVEAEARQRGIR